ncbi:MAG: hypothetical protein KDA25_07145 [Phycisphaerales bacterium]|nr:hypothetical protein [Phycisphaerales bacterium]
MATVVVFMVVLAGAAAVAAALRASGCPGAAVLGGVLAGLLLGPGVAGRLAPEVFERQVVGAVAERAAVMRLRNDVQATMHVADATGGDPSDTLADLRARLATAERVMHDAERTHQAPLRVGVLGIVALVLLAGGALHVEARTGGAGPIAATSIGGWAALLPGGVVMLLATWWGSDVETALTAAAAVAIGPWAMTSTDAMIADAAERGGAHLVRQAGRVATLLAVAAIVFAMRASPWALVALLGIPVGWLVTRRGGRVTRALTMGVLLPGLAAMTMLRIEPFLHASFWPIAAVLIVSGDGRWLGATIGALLPGGRRGWTAMRLGLPLYAAGPMQVAIVALGLWTDRLGGTMALALVIGAAATEVSAGLRRWLSARLDDAEAWSDGDDSEG